MTLTNFFLKTSLPQRSVRQPLTAELQSFATATFSRSTTEKWPLRENQLLLALPTEDVPSWLPHKLCFLRFQNSTRTDLAVARTIQGFDWFKSVPYPFFNPGLEHPPPSLFSLMYARYYFSGQQAMHLKYHVHSPSPKQPIVEASGSMTGQKAQACAEDESNPANGEENCVSLMQFSSTCTQRRRTMSSLHHRSMRNICCVTLSYCTDSSLSACSIPMSTKMPGGWCLSGCTWAPFWPPQAIPASWIALASFPFWEMATSQ